MHVEFLANIGPRLAGTANEAIAASYIENEFRSYGLEVWVENFIVKDSYSLEESRLSVVRPVQMGLPCIPVIYSPSGKVQGQLMYLDDTLENENLLRERVVLVQGSRLKRWLADIPPLAILIYLENMPPISEIWPDPPGAPMVWISGGDAAQLIKLLEQGEVEVELELKAKTEPSISSNVIAWLRGESNEIIVINAHHDSMLTRGAVDDASGVAVVLEIARELSAERLKRTIAFATFGGEELGLLGSGDFVNKHKQDIVASITFDCISAGPDNGLRVGLEDSPEYVTTDWLDNYVRRIAENLGLYAQRERLEVIHGYTDHVSFVRAGIPATWIYWVNPEHEYSILGPVHTLADNLEAIDEHGLEQAVELGVEVVRSLSAWQVPGLTIGAAVFTLLSMGIAVLSVGMGCFTHYKRGWNWQRTALMFSLIAIAAVALAYLVLLLW
jgi:aminopeptidase YwaD